MQHPYTLILQIYVCTYKVGLRFIKNHRGEEGEDVDVFHALSGKHDCELSYMFSKIAGGQKKQ